MKNKDLWEQSRELAKKLYEEEYGAGTWFDADKYEREDYYWTAYKQILENENKNARELAYKAAEASHIGVGIGISDEVVLHYIKLKGDTPLFAISSQSNEENLRAIGSNAGRLMKRMPFRDVE